MLSRKLRFGQLLARLLCIYYSFLSARFLGLWSCLRFWWGGLEGDVVLARLICLFALSGVGGGVGLDRVRRGMEMM